MSRTLPLAVLLGLVSLAAVMAHPHPFRLVDGLASPSQQCDMEPRPHIYSWHIHVLWNGRNKAESEKALAFHDAFMKEFNLSEGPCNDQNVTHPPTELCMFKTAFPTPEGPFPVADWSVYVPNKDHYRTVSWVLQHRDQFSVLVHPNTGCEVADHRDWMVWGGTPWTLDLSVMSHNCPGCSDWDCQMLGKQTILAGMFSKCGLQLRPGGAPFALTDKTAFCQPICQEWVRQVIDAPRPCPRVCDFFKQPAQDNETCRSHVASIPDLKAWTEQCSKL